MQFIALDNKADFFYITTENVESLDVGDAATPEERASFDPLVCE